jgi:glycosyltransferase involved in cell wall biosynthesis
MIVAVILTYNRPDLIKEAVRSIICQTVEVSKIIVVDNASELPVHSVLKDLDCIDQIQFVRLDQNVGSHKGFEAGFECFKEFAKPGDWLWVLDDDAHPIPTALEKLKSFTHISTVITPNKKSPNGMLFPLLHTYSADDGTRKYYTQCDSKGWSATNIVSFEGLFISYESLVRVPRLDFNLFICDDDTLFGQLVSIFENPIIVSEPLLQRKFDDNGLASWKIFYAIRNKIIVRKLLLNYKYEPSLRSSVIFYLNLAIDILFYLKKDLRNVKGVLRGLFQGLAFNKTRVPLRKITDYER